MPANEFVFSKSKEGSRVKRFNYSCLEMFKWLIYSEHLDGAFCLPCALFVKPHRGHNSSKLDGLINSPMVKWTTTRQRLVSHSNGKCLTRNCSVIAMKTVRSMRHEVVPIDQQFDNLLQLQIANNRQIMSSLFKTVIFCGRNNIALRGHRDDDPTNDSEPPSFAIVSVGKWRSSFRRTSTKFVLECYLHSLKLTFPLKIFYIFKFFF